MATQTPHPTVRAMPLGAGQDVGRSCVLITLGNKNVMFDCGMHMGYQDERRFPDFSYVSTDGHLEKVIDAVVITHFHLDHCGALPYFSEMCGYDGPIYMTYPTKAICPILLEDYRKISVERHGLTNFFTSEDIKNCMKKVIPINLHQTIKVGDGLEIKSYYAGHVLGAAMFYVKNGPLSVVYTGDYNMTPDRHLGSAWMDRTRPDLLITETTYATTIRDSKRCRERNFLKKVHSCVSKGGKVLIPVFALGRAQELCILLSTFWERMNLKVPLYFSQGMTTKANMYYKLFINWTNQKIKDTFVKRNLFDFSNILTFDRSMMDQPGPMVLFATPGMLHAGLSLDVFKRWAPNPLNMVILPGYCVVGTVGNKLISGRQHSKTIEIDKHTSVEVNCKVKYLSFSAHADAKGIMQLIRQTDPRNVMLVHGEKKKMQFLKQQIRTEFNVPCYCPANGETVDMEVVHSIPIDISNNLMDHQFYKDAVPQCSDGAASPGSSSHNGTKRRHGGDDVTNNGQEDGAGGDDFETANKKIRPMTKTPVHGLLVLEEGTSVPRLIDPVDAPSHLGLRRHSIRFRSSLALPADTKNTDDDDDDGVRLVSGADGDALMKHIYEELRWSVHWLAWCGVVDVLYP
eukprot:TRINITY_DN4257_c0_g1_i1.p1 TRINITY_DN4257_c0_g1~~TRINITY_DN4257_c0_g1_i1.p1  ORF type:complete len:628 (+),score=142.44 TRINITY_DN4257_c0_g1_i1:279-2162(+)